MEDFVIALPFTVNGCVVDHILWGILLYSRQYDISYHN